MYVSWSFGCGSWLCSSSKFFDWFIYIVCIRVYLQLFFFFCINAWCVAIGRMCEYERDMQHRTDELNVCKWIYGLLNWKRSGETHFFLFLQFNKHTRKNRTINDQRRRGKGWKNTEKEIEKGSNGEKRNCIVRCEDRGMVARATDKHAKRQRREEKGWVGTSNKTDIDSIPYLEFTKIKGSICAMSIKWLMNSLTRIFVSTGCV